MSGSIANFITVDRILNDKDKDGSVKKNGKTRQETININFIRGCRTWHKSEEDKHVDGPMTMLTIQSNDSKEKVMTMLIAESAESFNARLAQQTLVL